MPGKPPAKKRKGVRSFKESIQDTDLASTPVRFNDNQSDIQSKPAVMSSSPNIDAKNIADTPTAIASTGAATTLQKPSSGTSQASQVAPANSSNTPPQPGPDPVTFQDHLASLQNNLSGATQNGVSSLTLSSAQTSPRPPMLYLQTKQHTPVVQPAPGPITISQNATLSVPNVTPAATTPEAMTDKPKKTKEKLDPFSESIIEAYLQVQVQVQVQVQAQAQDSKNKSEAEVTRTITKTGNSATITDPEKPGKAWQINHSSKGTQIVLPPDDFAIASKAIVAVLDATVKNSKEGKSIPPIFVDMDNPKLQAFAEKELTKRNLSYKVKPSEPRPDPQLAEKEKPRIGR